MSSCFTRTIAIVVFLCVSIVGANRTVKADEPSSDYKIKPGDVLLVNVWKEQDLTMEVLVRPDGRFSFPLAGDLEAAGHSVEEVRQALIAKISSFVPDAAATVMVKSIEGNRAYVVGKVGRPGPITMAQETNVMQALSIAGGTAQFAELKRILILRGQGTNQSAIHFNYNEVQDGENLEQNVVLMSGDVVVVP